MKLNDEDVKYFKGRYCIVYYDKTDENCVAMFNNIWEICKYKKLEMIPKNYTITKVELYRALKRPGQITRMLNGKLMHVYLIDIISEDEDEY